MHFATYFKTIFSVRQKQKIRSESGITKISRKMVKEKSSYLLLTGPELRTVTASYISNLDPQTIASVTGLSRTHRNTPGREKPTTKLIIAFELRFFNITAPGLTECTAA